MDKKAFYDWMDKQIELYEKFHVLVTNITSEIKPFGDNQIRNIEFQVDNNKCIQLGGLCEMAPLLGIELIKEPYDHPIAGNNYGGRCYLEYRGYSFFDLYAKENSTDA